MTEAALLFSSDSHVSVSHDASTAESMAARPEHERELITSGDAKWVWNL